MINKAQFIDIMIASGPDEEFLLPAVCASSINHAWRSRAFLSFWLAEPALKWENWDGTKEDGRSFTVGYNWVEQDDEDGEPGCNETSRRNTAQRNNSMLISTKSDLLLKRGLYKLKACWTLGPSPSLPDWGSDWLGMLFGYERGPPEYISDLWFSFQSSIKSALALKALISTVLRNSYNLKPQWFQHLIRHHHPLQNRGIFSGCEAKTLLPNYPDFIFLPLTFLLHSPHI